MSELGINFIQILSYIVVFLLIYFFARGFIKKTLATADVRKQTIAEGIKNAELAQSIKKEKLLEAEEERKILIQKAMSEAQTIIDNAKAKEDKIMMQAQEKADAFLLHSQKEINESKQKARNDGLAEAEEIIKLAIQKAFQGYELDKKTEEKLIEKSLENL